MKKIKNRKYSDFNELFYRLTLQDKFQDFIGKARAELKIPPKGFVESQIANGPTNPERFLKLIKNESALSKAMIIANKICGAYKLEDSGGWTILILKYIFLNKIDTTLIDASYGCEMLKRSNFKTDKDFANKIGQDVVIRIYPQATRQDVLRFINDSWEEIEMRKWLLREYWEYDKKTKQRFPAAKWREKPTPYFPKFKPTTKREEHEKIFQIYKQGHIKSTGTLSWDKEWQDFGLPHQQPDTVKKIILKQKKLHKGEL